MYKRISDLQEQLSQGKITRRGFIRYATILGLSLGAAEALAACAPKPTPTPVEWQTPEGWRAYIPGTDNIVPTPEWQPSPLSPGTPTPTVFRPIATPTPVLWEEATWSCPSCEKRFRAQEAWIRHILAKHARKIPGVRKVSRPTYSQFLVGPVERFDQKNHVFSRTVWDEEYKALLQSVIPRKTGRSELQLMEGRALKAGSIYVDDTAGSLHPKYGGYTGHMVNVGGLYDWNDPVNPTKLPVSDPAHMSERIKEVARFYGADLVGICELDQRWVYSHYFDRETGAYGVLDIS